MQLAPTSAPVRTVDASNPLRGHQVVGSAKFVLPPFMPGMGDERTVYATVWTVGEDLAPRGGWASKEQAVAAVKLLSVDRKAPIALTTAPDPAAGGALRFHAHHVAQSHLRDERPSPFPAEPVLEVSDRSLVLDHFRSFQREGSTVGLYIKGGEAIDWL